MALDQVLARVDSALLGAQLVTTPFPHFAIPDLLDTGTADAILKWLESDAPWVFTSRRFYHHHCCTSLDEVVGESSAAAAFSSDVLRLIREHLERIFQVSLSQTKIEVNAHRMLPGHRIGIHTDTPNHGTETHRFLINLNEGFDDSYGGHLVLFDKDNLCEDALVVLPPRHNSAAAMEFSDRSWHWVDEVKSGMRFSLVYSFWRESAVESWQAPRDDNQPDIETAPADQDQFQVLLELLREAGSDRVPHTSRRLIDHLVGTYRILEEWQCDDDVCNAGLIHSIFGTPSFPSVLDTEILQQGILDAIGDRALALAQLFSRSDAPMLRRLLVGEPLSEGNQPVVIGINDVKGLLCLFWANVLEQSPYAPLSESETARLKSFYDQGSQLLPPASRPAIRQMLEGEKLAGSSDR